MQFNLESSSGVNVVRAYSCSELRIAENRVRTSCIVTADRLITEWEPRCFEELAPAHLAAVLALEPQIVLLGTGPRQRFPPPAIHSAFTQRGVGLEVMDLGAACRTFNILVQEDRRVAAVLFLE